MPKPLTISIPHQLGREEARRRLQEGMGQARTQLGAVATSIEDHWNGDRMDFRVVALAQAVAGRIEVRDDAIDMEVELPWALAVLAGKLKSRIEQQGSLMLEKK